MNEYENPMYQFVDTIIDEDYRRPYIPTSAMFYDGKLIEDMIDGYTTLSVTGREMISIEIESDNTQFGAIISNQKIPPRSITVRYKLEDRNPLILQEKFDKLMSILYKTEDVSIRFNDELDFYYYGRFSSADEVPGDTNSVVSSFTIFCQKPFKYSKENHILSGKKVAFNGKVQIENIIVNLKRDKSITISNGREIISINSSPIKIGDEVQFNLKKGVVLVNGKNKTRLLDLASDFKNFTLKSGDVINCDNGVAEIIYRGVRL